MNTAPQISKKGVRHLFSDVVERAVEVLRAGGVIVYPTDTVYGLGADATNSEAIERVRTIKRRDADKPILAMVGDFEMLDQYALLTDLACNLAQKYLPGALSLVLEPRGEATGALRGPDGVHGFRMPNAPLALALCQALGRPITSTSVNIAGKPQPRELSDMLQAFGEVAANIDLVLDAGALPASLPSTVIDARGERALILREGAIPRQELAAFL